MIKNKREDFHLPLNCLEKVYAVNPLNAAKGDQRFVSFKKIFDDVFAIDVERAKELIIIVEAHPGQYPRAGWPDSFPGRDAS